jgi:DNA-binding transcriptional ArsR family regulator
MKRDMELARLILMRIEAQENYRDNISCEFEGYAEEQVHHHIMLLSEAGLVVAINVSSMQDIQWIPQRLTWQGHEFLDSARDNTIWSKAKEIMARTGGFAFEVAKPLLVELLKQQIGLRS